MPGLLSQLKLQPYMLLIAIALLSSASSAVVRTLAFSASCCERHRQMLDASYIETQAGRLPARC